MLFDGTCYWRLSRPSKCDFTASPLQGSVLPTVERRESTPLLEKFKVTDVTMAQQVKLLAALEKQKEVKKKTKKKNNQTPMMKYLKTQV